MAQARQEGGVSVENKAYIKARNKLIPKAVEFANKEAGARGPKGTNEQRAQKWNVAFHNKMNSLWLDHVNAKKKVVKCAQEAHKKRRQRKK